jgi:hypothetical protein
MIGRQVFVCMLCAVCGSEYLESRDLIQPLLLLLLHLAEGFALSYEIHCDLKDLV